MELPRPHWFDPAFADLLAGRNLDESLTTELFRDILAGRVDDVLTSALVTALRVKGETAAEIAGATRGLRERMLRLVPVTGPVIDTCGTGGDDSGTFNISTAVAFVVAGAGVPVVKHGGRAVSSRSGSADVLQELGISIEMPLETAQKALDRLGFAFCYAPFFHPGLANVGPLRRKLRTRTIFNLLGPLANPASADYQLLGVGRPELIDELAGAVARLGIRRAALVSGSDGLDEVTLSGPTNVRIVEREGYRIEQWTPEDFALERVELAEIRASGPEESANTIRSVLAGEPGPARRIVLANAAAALWVADKVPTLRDGVTLAEESIQSGAAARVLAGLRSLDAAPQVGV